MARKIPLSQLEAEIVKELYQYSLDVAEEVKKKVQQAGKGMVRELRGTAPKDTGEHAKGWTSKVEFENAEDIRVRVYNRSKPQLTHLLEYGHAKTNGGRVEGKPHIRPAEEEAARQLVDEVKAVMKG